MIKAVLACGHYSTAGSIQSNSVYWGHHQPVSSTGMVGVVIFFGCRMCGLTCSKYD